MRRRVHHIFVVRSRDAIRCRGRANEDLPGCHRQSCDPSCPTQVFRSLTFPSTVLTRIRSLAGPLLPHRLARSWWGMQRSSPPLRGLSLHWPRRTGDRQSTHTDGTCPQVGSWPMLARMRTSLLNMAHQVDQILKGANPADIPIQQATTFRLIVNLKARRRSL